MVNTACTNSRNSSAFDAPLLANTPQYRVSNGVNYNITPHGNPRSARSSTQTPGLIPTIGFPREDKSESEDGETRYEEIGCMEDIPSVEVIQIVIPEEGIFLSELNKIYPILKSLEEKAEDEDPKGARKFGSKRLGC